MKKFKVIKRFAIFEYNEKTKGHKIKWFEVDEMVKESMRNKLQEPSRYILEINN